MEADLLHEFALDLELIELGTEATGAQSADCTNDGCGGGGATDSNC